MNSKFDGLDWGLIKSFLAVYRQGSLSAASDVLGVSQPTLSRNIQALEKATQLQLFQRTTQGVRLSEAGKDLVEAAEHMAVAAEWFSRRVSGLSENLQGDIRISANEIVGVYLLPPALAALRKQYPELQVELVISNKVSSLSRREADIALRMFRPSQPDLVARRLPDLEMGFYAHKDYIKERGEPKDFADLKEHTLIGPDEDLEMIQQANELGWQISRRDFTLRTDHLLAQIALARSAAGIIGTHVGLAKGWPDLQRILKNLPLPPLQFWIVCHSDTQHNSRVRTTTEFLGNWFGKAVYAKAMS